MFPTKDELTEILVKNIMGEGKHFLICRKLVYKTFDNCIERNNVGTFIADKTVYENLTVIRASGQILDDKGYDFGVDRKGAVKSNT